MILASLVVGVSVKLEEARERMLAGREEETEGWRGGAEDRETREGRGEANLSAGIPGRGDGSTPGPDEW